MDRGSSPTKNSPIFPSLHVSTADTDPESGLTTKIVEPSATQIKATNANLRWVSDVVCSIGTLTTFISTG
jgi:hypothetical protein